MGSLRQIVTNKQTLVMLTVPGRPCPKGRPRFASTGQAYTPERTRIAEEMVRAYMRQACPIPLEGALELMVAFCFRRPQSWSKTRRDAVDDGDEPWYTGRPDLDNLVKTVKDAGGNGILWNDDAQFVKLEALKVYSAESETVINVFSADE